ncbi:MAG: MFS transporter [Hydrogenophilales bacterium]|jgi:predicted MFS family arabinose efflux permease
MKFLIVSCCAISFISFGIRQSQGLFLFQINSDSQIGIGLISFSLAIGQLLWGIIQPIASEMTRKYGEKKVLIFGLLILLLGLILTPLSINNSFFFLLNFGVLISLGSGICSLSILISIVQKSVSENKKGFFSSLVTTSASFGQFIIAPLTQLFIILFGWKLSLIFLGLLVLSFLFFCKKIGEFSKEEKTISNREILLSLKKSFFYGIKNSNFNLVCLSFFSCGFHIAFLITHLPGEINLCGLSQNVASISISIIGIANILGTILVGYLNDKYRSKDLLFLLYFFRALIIIIYLFSPKTTITFVIFSFFIGITWLSTIPPTANLIGKFYGVDKLGTMFGISLIYHQIGAFFGAWLGGIVILNMNSLYFMWIFDASFALIAAFLNLPIKEKKLIISNP